MPSLFELRAITFAYPGRAPILQALDLQIAPGERLAIHGPNGAGKSTLLHLLVGLLKPQAGALRAFGAERRVEADFHAVRCRAGLLFQDPDDQLFCPTVAEDVAFGPLNLGYSRAETRRIVERTLGELGLEGYGERVTYHLSGGEKRLVALATVLAMSPEVLLLDEPGTALDEPTRERLIEVLDALPQAQVLVSHDAPFLERLAEHHYRLEAGRLIACAP